MPPKKPDPKGKSAKPTHYRENGGSFSFPYFSMPPKKPDPKGKSAKPTQKKTGSSSGGKNKKKKWSKGKVRDRLNNMCLFDKATYDKLFKEVPGYKVITCAIVSERLKIRGSLAKKGLTELHQKGLIKLVSRHASLRIYTRSIKEEAEA